MNTEERVSISNSSCSSESDECFVCYEKSNSFNEVPIEIGDVDLIIRNCECKGKIHYRCFFEWLQNNFSCPICRKPVQLSPTLQTTSLGPNERSLSHIVILPNYGTTHQETNLIGNANPNSSSNHNLIQGININNQYINRNHEIQVIPFNRQLVRQSRARYCAMAGFVGAMFLFVLILIHVSSS